MIKLGSGAKFSPTAAKFFCNPVAIVRRGLLLFLLVALCAWTAPNVGALTCTPDVPAPHYDELVAVLVVVLGDGITLDTDEGKQEAPLSLHKYLYCQDNPVDHKDPSGHEIEGELAVMDIDSVSMGFRLPGVTAVSQSPAQRRVQPRAQKAISYQ
jgi:hypothetical protein